MTNEAPQLPIKEGDVLAGKYRVRHVLGVGGMGAVVAAVHLTLDDLVAIKLLLPSQITRPDAVARFVREARAASKIKSEHVAKVLDVGTLDTGAPYMVMEYLEGEDLAQRLRRGPLSVSDAVDYVLQACEAMAEAHSRGIVHRDLKPSNLFCVRRHDGSIAIKVLDFGISKVSGDLADGLRTRTQAVFGSPFYMAPEQMSSSRSVDARADIWSLGVILHEALAGHPPFRADDLTVLVARVLHEAPPALVELRPDVPPELAAAIACCLEKSPDARFPSVSALVASLVPFAPPERQAAVARLVRQSQKTTPPEAGSLPPATPPLPRLNPLPVIPGANSLAESGPVDAASVATVPPATKRRTSLVLGSAAGAFGLAALALVAFRALVTPSGSPASAAPLPVLPETAASAPPSAPAASAAEAPSAPAASAASSAASSAPAASAPAARASAAPAAASAAAPALRPAATKAAGRPEGHKPAGGGLPTDRD